MNFKFPETSDEIYNEKIPDSNYQAIKIPS